MFLLDRYLKIKREILHKSISSAFLSALCHNIYQEIKILYKKQNI